MDAYKSRRSHQASNRQRILAWSGLALLLLTPPTILELLNESAGDPGDFVFASILVVGAGLAYEAAARTSSRWAYPVGWALAILAALLLAWINLAVGILGSEENPANLIYAGVLVVVLVGAVFARFRARGLAYSMLAAAIAQLTAFGIALAAGFGFTGPITVFFVALWLNASWLFCRAAGEMADPSLD